MRQDDARVNSKVILLFIIVFGGGYLAFVVYTEVINPEAEINIMGPISEPTIKTATNITVNATEGGHIAGVGKGPIIINITR